MALHVSLYSAPNANAATTANAAVRNITFNVLPVLITFASCIRLTKRCVLC